MQLDPAVLQHLRDGRPVGRRAPQRPLHKVPLLLAHLGRVVHLRAILCTFDWGRFRRELFCDEGRAHAVWGWTAGGRVFLAFVFAVDGRGDKAGRVKAGCNEITHRPLLDALRYVGALLSDKRWEADSLARWVGAASGESFHFNVANQGFFWGGPAASSCRR